MWINWIAVHSTDKHQQARVSDLSAYEFFNEPVANSFVLFWFPSSILLSTSEIPNISRYHTNDSTVSDSEAREATEKRGAPCSTIVFKSEGGAGANKTIFAVFWRLSFLQRACS